MSMQAFHPGGFRAMALACAVDLWDVLPRINVPTLLVYGERDVRAPLSVAKDLEKSIPDSAARRPAGRGPCLQHRRPPKSST